MQCSMAKKNSIADECGAGEMHPKHTKNNGVYTTTAINRKKKTVTEIERKERKTMEKNARANIRHTQKKT